MYKSVQFLAWLYNIDPSCYLVYHSGHWLYSLWSLPSLWHSITSTEAAVVPGEGGDIVTRGKKRKIL